MLDVRPIGTVTTKTHFVQKSYDECVERGGDAQTPEDLLTAILLQRSPSAYDAAKNGLLNSITLGNTAF